jgi:vitamin B12 transporter
MVAITLILLIHLILLIQRRIFGSIASGFKAPSLYQLYAGGGIGNAALLAEKSVNYEIGLQHQHKK